MITYKCICVSTYPNAYIYMQAYIVYIIPKIDTMIPSNDTFQGNFVMHITTIKYQPSMDVVRSFKQKKKYVWSYIFCV